MDVVDEPVGKVGQVLDGDGPVEEPLEIGSRQQLGQRVRVGFVDTPDEGRVFGLGLAQLLLLLRDLGVERRDLALQLGDPPLGGGNLVHRLVDGVARLLELLQQRNLLGLGLLKVVPQVALQFVDGLEPGQGVRNVIGCRRQRGGEQKADPHASRHEQAEGGPPQTHRESDSAGVLRPSPRLCHGAATHR
ncbi:MAG: hypothetical protein E6I43_07185 [Chloroflexi bacterium]|nr:MAG: hypothetical protein E6I43_07185 [Chloroflexota bacterium]